MGEGYFIKHINKVMNCIFTLKGLGNEGNTGFCLKVEPTHIGELRGIQDKHTVRLVSNGLFILNEYSGAN